MNCSCLRKFREKRPFVELLGNEIFSLRSLDSKGSPFFLNFLQKGVVMTVSRVAECFKNKREAVVWSFIPAVLFLNLIETHRS